MAGILGMWRMFAGGVMGGLVGVGALVVLNHPDFAAQAASVEPTLQGIDNPQLRMPVAPGLLLPSGVKGAFCAIAFFGVLAGTGDFAAYLTANPDRCPLNGQLLAFISMVAAGTMFVVVSLFTCKEDYDLDRLLHRGQYAIEELVTPASPTAVHHRFSWKRLIGIDEHYARRDKVIAGGIFFYTLFWKVLAVIILVWNLAIWRWPDLWWFNWSYATGIYLPYALGFLTTIWFTWGTSRDIVRLFRALRAVKRNDADDGRVRDHHNAGEPEPPANNQKE